MSTELWAASQNGAEPGINEGFQPTIGDTFRWSVIRLSDQVSGVGETTGCDQTRRFAVTRHDAAANVAVEQVFSADLLHVGPLEPALPFRTTPRCDETRSPTRPSQAIIQVGTRRSECGLCPISVDPGRFRHALACRRPRQKPGDVGRRPECVDQRGETLRQIVSARPPAAPPAASAEPADRPFKAITLRKAHRIVFIA